MKRLLAVCVLLVPGRRARRRRTTGSCRCSTARTSPAGSTSTPPQARSSSRTTRSSRPASRPASCGPTGSTRTSSPSSSGCTSTRPRSATPASSSGATRCRPSARAYTRGIEVQVLVNLTYKDKKTGAVTATSHGDLFSIWGAPCKPDRPHPAGLGALPAEREPRPRAAASGTTTRWWPTTAHQAARQRQGGVGRQQVQAAQGLPRPGVRRGRVPLPQPEDQGIAEHEPEAGGMRGRRRGVGTAVRRADLDGWKAEGGSWKVAGENLKAADKGDLVTTKTYGPGKLVFDWTTRDGKYQMRSRSPQKELISAFEGKAGKWNRATETFTAAGQIRFPASDGLELKNLFFKAY